MKIVLSFVYGIVFLTLVGFALAAQEKEIVATIESRIGNEFALLLIYETADTTTEEAMKAVAKNAREQLKIKRVNILFYSGAKEDKDILIGSATCIAPDSLSGTRLVPEFKKTFPERAKFLEMVSFFQISTVNLLKRYKNNEVVADEDFKGKRITVTGRVKKVGKDFIDAPYVYLSPDKYGFEGVRCYVDKDDPELRAIKSGDSVAISGVVTGYTMTDVGLEKCIIFLPEKYN